MRNWNAKDRKKKLLDVYFDFYLNYEELKLQEYLLYFSKCRHFYLNYEELKHENRNWKRMEIFLRFYLNYEELKLQNVCF